ncbi:MAG: glycoside hydrolase family 88 protein [Bacteroidota bacterium]|nr:glycoside hydrolase family 88 protein [Bacteroidota bacterium]
MKKKSWINHRYRFESLFKAFVGRLAKLQDKGVYWHASLLDPDSYPNSKTSSAGFYAIWWGINNGLLTEKEYKIYATKGWEAMVKEVHQNGMLGRVQPVGADPQKLPKI